MFLKYTTFLLTVLVVVTVEGGPENCPSGWHYTAASKKCMLVVSSKDAWNSIYKKCYEADSRSGLLAVQSQNDEEAFKSLTPKMKEGGCAFAWTSGKVTAGKWVWQDLRTEITKFFWLDPSKVPTEGCIKIDASAKWSAAPCTDQNCAVCEISA